MEYELTSSGASDDLFESDSGTPEYQSIQLRSAECMPDNTLVLEDVLGSLPGNNRFYINFPSWLDSWLSLPDDVIIAHVQKPLLGNTFYESALVCVARTFSVLTVVEIGFSIPLALLLLEQFDDLAILSAYEMLCLAAMTQIPKRFIKRARPFVAGRATAVVIGDGPDTSSFPARSVVGSTVYTLFAGLATQMTRNKQSDLGEIPWGPTNTWIWVLCGCLIVLTSWARILLGLHYPSDCFFGAGLGVLVHFSGVALAKYHYNFCGCQSEELTENVEGIVSSGAVVGFGTPVGLLLVILLERPPISYWKKSAHALSLLLPPLVFILAFICPKLSGKAEQLNLRIPRRKTSIETGLVAVALTVFFSCLGLCTQQQHAIKNSAHIQFAAFIFITVVSLISIVATRLVEQDKDEV